MPTPLNRRDFLAGTAAASLSAAAASPVVARAPRPGTPFPPLGTVRVGFVGIGVKGSAHLGNLLHMDRVEVVAVCDIVERQCVEAQKQAERLGEPIPTAYHRGDEDFRRMCDEQELDLVYTATPWRWHAPVCLAAMSTGSHAATEVPAAVTLKDCYKLVEAAEKHRRHCCMMENVNYQRTEMAVLNMVRRGLLGEVMHAEGGYKHDTRYLKSHDHGDGLWLAEHHAVRNGSLYPTHAVGPAAWYLNVNRGDRFEYLVSMSSHARGLKMYMEEHLPPGHPKREREYRNGDVSTTLLKLAGGATCVITHDTDLPRPYSRRNLVQGTRGVFRGFPRAEISLEGDTHAHRWEPAERVLSEYEHPLWEKVGAGSLGARPDARTKPIVEGAVWDYHPPVEVQNGDFLEDFRLIDALRAGRAPDFDVYDAATWSAIAPLSERSVAARSRPVDVPDFTGGRWKTAEPVTIANV